MESQARPDEAWPGAAGLGVARQARPGLAWQALARQGRRGVAWHGQARRGKAGVAWLGVPSKGQARHSRHVATISNLFFFIMEKQFRFRSGSRIKGDVDANVVGKELERIADKHDGIRAQDVVDESTPEDAALHPCFTWDDKIAANEHRKHQARSIVRSVRVIYPDKEESEPAFVHVRHESEEDVAGCYQRSRVVASNFSLYENAWRAARERLASAVRALRELEELGLQCMTDTSNVSVAKEKASEAYELMSTK